jgi:GNAT superfamily N-acetyltransferase
MTTVAVRLAGSEDLDAVMEMLGLCITAMRAEGIDQWDEIYPNRPRLLDDVQAGTLYLGAVDGGQEVAGAMVLNDFQDPEYADVPWAITGVAVAVVHRLMVSPRHQGKGVARALMSFAETRARELGFGAIRLDAFAANPAALRLYRGLGYREAGGVTFRKGPFRCFEKALRG